LPGVEVWALPGRQGRVDPKALLRRLAERDSAFVLVEGGAETHADFLGLARPGPGVLSDQIQFLLAPKLLGGRTAPGPVGGLGAATPGRGVALQGWSWKALGPDLLISARPVRMKTRRS
jgi:diaminohydroxyphosphoribosylaminopyrimidine deaminase/5-amino-6-(5-phosphoribosylamino)uracil reductase